MHISSLFQPIIRGPKPVPLAADQFEFDIDRAGRRIVGPFSGMLVKTETVRIQGNRPFTWTGDTVLPDTSLGELRQFRCQVHMEGILPASEPQIRAILTALLKDGYDFDRLFYRALGQAVAEQRRAFGGNFFDALAFGQASVQAALAAAVVSAGLPVERVELRPRQYDLRPAFDLVDETDGVAIRSRDALEQHRITYKARLVWGRAREQLIACLAYDDKAITGRTPGPAMERPLVTGQIMPLEAYFRQLLIGALAQEPFAAIVAGEAAMLARVKSRISGSLGRGTGRVVDTLVIYPVLADLGQLNERSARFLHDYAITGIRGDTLRIEHVIRFTLTDRDRWRAQNSPDPEAFLRDQMRKATELFLHDKRFEDVVGLYLAQGGEALLGREVIARVSPIAATIGYRLDSSTAILAIPEHDFVVGTEIVLPESEYQLADAHLKPRMRLRVTVRVVDGNEFARALARQDDFRGQICTAIEQDVRTTLRSRSALDYYNSPSVNGVALPPDAGAGLSQILVDDAFSGALLDRLGTMLGSRFGLEVTHLDIEPGADPIIDRMQGLANRSIPYSEVFPFRRGGPATTVEMKADATIFVTGLAPAHWSSFYRSVRHFADDTVHIEAIKAMLRQTLSMLEHALVGDGRAALLSRDLHVQVVERFTERLREEFGLEAKLRPLSLSVYRPTSDRTVAMMLDAANLEFANALEARARLQDAASIDAEFERDRLTRRIDTIRKEIKALTEEQEETIGKTEAVQVLQDLKTGRIEPALTANGILPPPDRGKPAL